MEEEEVFEILDYTAASEWEKFTARIEETIHVWKLSKNENYSAPSVALNSQQLIWKENHTELMFGGFPFIVTHLRAELKDHDGVSSSKAAAEGSATSECDAFDGKFVFANEDLHPIAKWYGLFNFVLISPAGNEPITSESKAKLLLSSIIMAINNSHCSVPVFAQIHPKSYNYYMGVFECENKRTLYDTIYLKRTPQGCNCLTGLLDLFKGKIATNSIPVVNIAARFTYILNEWGSDDWPQEPPDFDFLQGNVGVSALGKLAFGALRDPVNELRMCTVWPSVREDLVADSDFYTDLIPTSAPLWTLQAKLVDYAPGLLSDALTELLEVCKRPESTEQLLGSNFTILQSPDSPEYSQALGALTQPVLRNVASAWPLARVLSSTHSNKDKERDHGPIPDRILTMLLCYLFPDAEGNNPTHPYPAPLGKIGVESSGPNATFKEQLSNLKSCVPDGLVWRCMLLTIYANQYLSGLPAVAHLWHEIVLELRYRWEHGYLLPGLTDGLPDLGFCRLHQSLQLLNCCIARRKARESSQENSNEDEEQSVDYNSLEGSGEEEGENEEEEEEFFDAAEDTPGPSSNNGDKSARYAVLTKAQGRLKPCGQLKLLNSKETLYVPITQDPAPMTEDLLEEQTEILMQLGNDAQGSELRARLMSASLLSDMEAFKAANPGAVLEDFVRWHSPRDWIEYEDVTEDGRLKLGHLSARMQIPGNTWQQVWKTAYPIPARRQRRLFDDTKQAEKVLQNLASLKPSEICRMLLPVVVHGAMERLLQEDTSDIPNLPSALQRLVAKAINLARQYPPDLDQYEDFVRLLAWAELAVSQAQSLKRKLGDHWPEFDETVTELLGGQVVTIRGAHSPSGRALLQLVEQTPKMEQADKKYRGSPFPAPLRREFILQVKAERPGPGSTPSSQRMYCVLQSDSFRVAGSFTEDTMFR